MVSFILASLGCPIEHIFIKILPKIEPNLYKIHTKGCFPLYNGPQDVSGIINKPSGINFALEISRNCHTNNVELIFQQLFLICIKCCFLLLLWHALACFGMLWHALACFGMLKEGRRTEGRKGGRTEGRADGKQEGRTGN